MCRTHISRKLFKLRSHLWHFSGRATSTLNHLFIRHDGAMCIATAIQLSPRKAVTYTDGEKKERRMLTNRRDGRNKESIQSVCTILCRSLSVSRYHFGLAWGQGARVWMRPGAPCVQMV